MSAATICERCGLRVRTLGDLHVTVDAEGVTHYEHSAVARDLGLCPTGRTTR